MTKCLTKDCDYFNIHGECSSVCINEGYTKVFTNHDRIQNMSVEEMSDFLKSWAMDFMMGKVPMNVSRWLESEVDTL